MLDFENIRKTTFRIGDFRVEPTRNLLKKDGQTFPLEPKIMDVLCELASFPGEVIARYDLVQRIWKVDYGADESLTRAISVLRKTFKKGGVSAKYIETISKNGYRLIASVSVWEDDGSREISQPAKILEQTEAAVTPTAKTHAEPAASQQPTLRQLSEAPKAHAAAQTLSVTATPPAPANSKLTPILAASTIGLCLLLIVGLIGGKGYIDGQKRAFEDNLADVRDLTKVDPGALDNIDPIAVTEPFRGNVALGLPDFGRSVAVLPFKDMSEDGTKRYFADGMSEEIQLELSAIEGLRIVGRSAAENSLQNGMSQREVGELLKVSHLIDGSVRTMNDRVRVSAQLVDASSQSQIWGQSYDGALKDGLNLQAQIAQDIVSELNILLALNTDETFEFNLEGFTPTTVQSNISVLPLEQVQSRQITASGQQK